MIRPTDTPTVHLIKKVNEDSPYRRVFHRPEENSVAMVVGDNSVAVVVGEEKEVWSFVPGVGYFAHLNSGIPITQEEFLNQMAEKFSDTAKKIADVSYSPFVRAQLTKDRHDYTVFTEAIKGMPPNVVTMRPKINDFSTRFFVITDNISDTLAGIVLGFPMVANGHTTANILPYVYGAAVHPGWQSTGVISPCRVTAIPEVDNEDGIALFKSGDHVYHFNVRKGGSW